MNRRGFGVLVASLLVIHAAHGQQQSSAKRYTISGRVSDPHNLQPAEAVLMLGAQQGESVSYVPIRLQRNGTFVTHPLATGKYVLKVVRTPHSSTHAATDVALTIVEVREADVTGVVIEVRRDTALTGKFRMISDNPSAPWPPHIVVNAFLAMRGSPLLDGVGAEGASGAKFVLRNAFGPRVLRTGYTLAPGAAWWPSRVLLDGVDITDVPTDFSSKAESVLEVEFTQHPARIAGTVTDGDGKPVRAAWVLAIPAEEELRQDWVSTVQAVQANTRGEFSFATLPGEYLVRGFAYSAFDSYREARREARRAASGGTPVRVRGRDVATVRLVVDR
ncbi:MAG: hypothetical protein WBC51_06335 [Vicinamibacterales bacterium]